MRARFLLGAAALLGAVSAAGTAEAACSDLLNEARRPATTDARLTEISRLAPTECSSTLMVDRILAVIAGRRGATEEPPKSDNEPAPVASTPVSPAVPTPAIAQSFRSLTIGETQRSSLSAANPVDTENSAAYELWSFRVGTTERLQISMTAADGANLDTYLVVGRMRDGQFEELARNDDRGDGTLNSLVRFTPDAPGDYVIRARSFWRDQYGPYELIVQPTSSLQTASAVPRPLPLGQPVSSSLNAESASDAAGGGYSYELWTFNAVAGQRVDVSMASNTIDPYLVVGRMRAGRFEEVASNDDGYDGTLNSMLRFVPDESGEYVIRARSFAGEQWGTYELLVQPTAPATNPVSVASTANAWVYHNEISAEEGSPRFVDFAFDARPGRHYSIRANSGEFIPVVDVLQMQRGGALTEVDMFGASDREASTVDIPSAARGRYIFRVSTRALTSGNFDLIISEVR